MKQTHKMGCGHLVLAETLQLAGWRDEKEMLCAICFNEAAGVPSGPIRGMDRDDNV